MIFSKLEQEAVILNAVWDMIDGMVNYAMFDKAAKIHDTNLFFHSSTEGHLFNILLGDFLSLPQQKGNKPLPFDLPIPGKDVRDSDLTYLFYLRQLCKHPQLGPDATELQKHVEGFGAWLEAHTLVEKVWLSYIEVETDITISRFDYLKICADIAKHNFARLQSNVRKICRILKENGKAIDENQGFLALPNFYEWFHDDLFIYHSSVIAEFLNNIRWSIFRYLQREFARSYTPIDQKPMYKFDVPAECVQPLARAMYWDLMNRVRGRPFMPEFTISDSFKAR